MFIIEGMDELLIEDRKYVSSKRAAKITGYAKDYIGQLCREGRVPARLVGRSWYVLESAISDHRFGDQKSPMYIEDSSVQTSTEEVYPRYEIPVPENLPLTKNEFVEDVPPQTIEISESPKGLQDSWKEWFDRRTSPDSGGEEPQTGEDSRNDQVENFLDSEESINIPIHTIYELPPEDLLPPIRRVDAPITDESDGAKKEIKRIGSIRFSLLRLIIGTVTLITVVLAILGTGKFDKYIGSIGQIGAISGITVYNK